MKTIGLTGGTGFIGRHLAAELTRAGNKVIIFTRDPQHHQNQELITYAHWDAAKGEIDIPQLGKIDATINLAGAGIADKRWTEKRKKLILNSRVKGTTFLVEQLKEHAPQCTTFISASAIGFYGPDRTPGTPFREDAPPYNDFLANTCQQWEAASQPIATIMRRVIFRFGIVLGKGGGSFPQFEKPQSFGAVPILGNGKQAISWIHIKDLVSLIHTAINEEKWEGIYNAATPHAVSNEQLMKIIAKEKGGIKIPFHVPAAVLKIMLGEMATEVLKSCTVSAEKIANNGFRHQYDTIGKAVKEILSE